MKLKPDELAYIDEIYIYFKEVMFLCSDMNPIYADYFALNKMPQYVINSEAHKIIQSYDTEAKLTAAYEQDKLDYIAGVGIMTYRQMCKVRAQHNLTINGVNGLHSKYERVINRIAKGVSTKHLNSWIAF